MVEWYLTTGSSPPESGLSMPPTYSARTKPGVTSYGKVFLQADSPHLHTILFRRAFLQAVRRSTPFELTLRFRYLVSLRVVHLGFNLYQLANKFISF